MAAQFSKIKNDFGKKTHVCVIIYINFHMFIHVGVVDWKKI